MKPSTDAESPAKMNSAADAHPKDGARRRRLSLAILWWLGGISLAAIVLAFTPLTHRLDDIKLTLQFGLAPLVAVVLAVVLLHGEGQPIPRWIGLSLLAYVLFGLLSTLAADFRWRAWQELGFELCLMVAFLTVAFTASTRRRLENFCRFSFIVACVTVVFGLFHYFVGTGWLLRRVLPESPFYAVLATLERNREMFSTVLNRDFYASFLIMIVPLAAAYFLQSRTVVGRVFYAIAGFFYCLCIVLAGSNDSNLALAVMFATMLGLLVFGRQWAAMPRRLLMLWVAGGAVLLATTLFFLRSYLYAIPRDLQIAFHSRSILWSGAWNVFFDPEQPTAAFVRRLLFGAGPGGFMLLFPAFRSPDFFLWQLAPIAVYPHSQPLGLLSERGLLGTLAFASFVGGIFWLLVREIRRRPDHPLHLLQIALFTSLVGVTVQNLTSPSIRWTVCGFTYWYLLGLAVAAARLSVPSAERNRLDAKPALPPRLYQVSVILLLVGAVVFSGISIPYGVRWFLAARCERDGQIRMRTLERRIDQLNASAPGETMEETRRLALQDARAAEADFRRAVRYLPSSLSSRYGLGYTASRHTLVTADAGEKESSRREALEAYDTLASYAPAYADIEMGYAFIYQLAYIEATDKESESSRRNRDRALHHLERAARMTNALPYHWTLAEAYEAMGDPEHARAVCRRILELAPGRIRNRRDTEIQGKALDLLLEHARATDNREELIALSRQRLAVDPFDAPTFADLVENLRHLGRDREALQCCEEWIERNPLDPLPRGIAARTLLDHNEFRQALQQLLALLAIQQRRRQTVAGPWALPAPERVRTLRNPNMENLWYWAGHLIEQAGGTTEALRCYEYSVSAAPRSTAARQARAAHKALSDRLKTLPKSPKGKGGTRR